jgi:hypothetical protein
VDHYGTHTGVSVGSTTSQTSAHLQSNGPRTTCPSILRTPSAPTNVQKPGFLQVMSPPSTASACSGNSCETQIQYQVLDTNGANMNVPGMTVQEYITVGGSCGPGNWSDSSAWSTGANGQLLAPDTIYVCASGSGSCQLQITQTFTVDGYPVLIMSKDRNQTGTKNIITINLNGNQASCPTVTITP